jgi:hypothetical protein
MDSIHQVVEQQGSIDQYVHSECAAGIALQVTVCIRRGAYSELKGFAVKQAAGAVVVT